MPWRDAHRVRHHGRVITLSEPQVWTLIGVFSTILFGMFAATSGYFVRIMRSEIGGLRGEMNAKFERVDAQFERVDAQFERVDAQFERVYDRLNYLDRDVQALTRHVFPDRD